jgi:prolyl-tRNA synthetase
MSANEVLSDPSVNLTDWYQEVIVRAELAEQAQVKGCMVIRPYGYAIWELIQSLLDKRLKNRGVQNAYFPLLIPQSYLAREKAHVEGFSPECAVVTHAGGEKLTEPLIVRPTSETIIHESMSKWVQSYRDLPLRINQWCNVVRWEKRPRLFLRNTEFLWQEGHTAHANEEDAKKEVSEMLAVYHDFVAEVLAIPTVTGLKSEAEKFAGAAQSYSIEGLMPDGKGLQMGTVHYLGENFSRMANVMFLGKDGKRRYVHMTSWGVSTRLIGALIMVHGDKRGLVLPPSIAPVQVVIVPIAIEKDPKGVSEKVASVAERLRSLGLRVLVDDRDDVKPGAKYYYHEMRGVPLRIEIGPRDAASGSVVCAFRTREGKETLDCSRLEEIPSLLQKFQDELRGKATALLAERIISPSSRDKFVECLTAQNGFIRASWCGDNSCEQAIKEATSATIRNIPHSEESCDEPCIWCGQKGKFYVHFAKAY